jgi:hypothetical protein
MSKPTLYSKAFKGRVEEEQQYVALVSAAIEGLARSKPSFFWREVVDAVNSVVTVPYGEWLSVRSVLQWYVKNAHLARSKDVFVEEYSLVKPL